jgi:hypothetical protein
MLHFNPCAYGLKGRQHGMIVRAHPDPCAAQQRFEICAREHCRKSGIEAYPSQWSMSARVARLRATQPSRPSSVIHARTAALIALRKELPSQTSA